MKLKFEISIDTLSSCLKHNINSLQRKYYGRI